MIFDRRRMTLCWGTLFVVPILFGVLTVAVVTLAEQAGVPVQSYFAVTIVLAHILLAGTAAALAICLWHPENRRRPMRTVTAFLFAASLCAGVIWGLDWAFSDVSRVIVTNNSGQTVHELSIEISGRHFDAKDLGDGESRTHWYKDGPDHDNIVILGRSPEGREIGLFGGADVPDGTLGGYGTGGTFLKRAMFVIRPSGQIDRILVP